MNPKPGEYSEDELIEQSAVTLFQQLGWEMMDCYHELDLNGKSALGRENTGEVILTSRMLPVLKSLNPDLPPEAFAQAIEELSRDRSLLSSVQANHEIYKMLKNGIKVKTTDKNGDEVPFEVKIIDWNNPKKNDYFLASQFWITGEMYKRRADLVGFVNGIPLVFIELKAVHKNLQTAFNDNIRDYKYAIPQVFWYNAFILISNGTNSKIGTISAEWEHFSDWKKINKEGEEGVVSLDTIIRGTCEPQHLLDITENFSLFQEARGGLIKLVAKNHQYLGVNHAIEILHEIKQKEGRLGVFWHTQGSGKSISMVFFAQKVLRKIPGNWTFVIITDRIELDDQIYTNFTSVGAVTEKKAQAESSEHLKQLLIEDHRYVFTLIQKFRTEELLSERSDIIVITDEAHRSQYDTLALNMRKALPDASFLAFTGTPLINSEEKTREVFGDYVSIYNFKQSVDDKATVPLFYENRIPELQLTNKDLNEGMYEIIEQAELDENQEKKLQREFAHQYHLITRDDRLETIAEDIVKHFTGRGYQGKAMVISVDKATAVRMYDKVQKYWKRYIEKLTAALAVAPSAEFASQKQWLDYIKSTDMAVVVSQGQNEVADMKKKGLDIMPHRRRMLKEDLDAKFKDPDDPFRVVFVCAMWMTGFDVPCCSTIYLDKPMRNHTLMQTIARANRVFRDKVNGLIVDYIGVFRSLKKALAIYGTGTGGGIEEADTPVKDKQALVNILKEVITEADTFCSGLGISTVAIKCAEGFQKIKLLDDAEDAIVTTDELKNKFLLIAYNVSHLYRAILPDPLASEIKQDCILFEVLARKINSQITPADISSVIGKVDDLLDRSVAAQGYLIRENKSKYDTFIDLSKVDFEKLKEQFEKNRKHIEADKLKTAIAGKLQNMIYLNRTRMDFHLQFQKMIDEYNAGSSNIDEFFKQLIKFAQGLNKEDKRSIAENLSEEELAVFDLLTKPQMKLTKKEELDVKKVAKDLLGTLKKEKLVLEWRKKQQAKAAVKVAIEEILEGLPTCYTTELYQQKVNVIYEHVYESYFGPEQNIYTKVGQ